MTGSELRSLVYKIQRNIEHMQWTRRNRKRENIFSSLRIGHAGLNSSLFKI